MKQLIKTCVFLLFLFCILFYGCRLIKAVGKTPSGEELKNMERQPNYKNGKFQNMEADESGSVKLGRVFKDMLHRPANVRPGRTLPSVKTDLIHSVYTRPTIVWFGHSSFLVKTSTANILVDPEFSDHAGPFSGIMKAFKGSNAYQVEDLPPIDVLVISHNHYDHLDYETILKLKEKVKTVIVPMGVGADFVYWGYDPKIIHELNWNQSFTISDHLSITATPARHFSGRMFKADKTLWASYVINVEGFKLFYSGDGGYGRHFRLIGQRFGPFDLAMMECGQYNKTWMHHHMFPWQTAHAAADLSARMIIPVHWAKFAESTHPWNEPVKLLIPAADSLHIPVCIPK